MSRKRLSAREREACFEGGDRICHLCERPIVPGEAWEVSHPIPLAAGGEDVPANRKPAHKKCHAERTATIDAPLIAKVRRVRQKHLGIRPTAGRPMDGSKLSPWRKPFNGPTVRRQP